MSFEDYMKNRQSTFEKLTQNLKDETSGDNKPRGDDRIWKPKMGADNTGYAVVRFLPGQDAGKTPWVRMYSHGFQGPTGKWYIENSLTTIGQKDPVSELNNKLWNNGTEAGKDLARKQKRRTSYFANVLVLKDPNNPENEGKVKIYQFGQKIFDKLMTAMQPEFADEDPINPFDLIEGANFRIKLKMVGGFWNYDASDFERPSALSDDMDRVKSVFDAQHDVHEMVEPSSFKSYEELQAKLNEVVGDNAPEARPQMISEPAPMPTAETSKTEVDDLASAFKESAPVKKDEDDDLEEYFKNLAAD